jgi:glycerol-3-phosphate dehydrogenase
MSAVSTPPLKPHYPVLIIGAGINGCGVFRDLSLQGIDCLLVDRGDICEGASAASSRLIHGGLKYLETGEFSLVRESAMERNRLLRNAPHYVKPLETVLPMRSWFGGVYQTLLRVLGFRSKVQDRGIIITQAALRIYDAYNRKVRALPDHRLLGSRRLRSDYPDLDPGIIAAALYHEGHITHAERLGLELVMDGLAANPGSALMSYTSIHSATGTLRLVDQLTGAGREVTADVIINAGGAWIDKVNAALGIVTRHMGGSKGSHLIVANPELHEALAGRMIYFGTADGRVNLVYPLFGHVLIGSTDIAVTDPDEASCSAAETDYMLSSVSQIFPRIKLARAQVLLTTCGVRPLPRADVSDMGSVSRDHAVAEDQLVGHDVPVLSLIGGKWTTFRAFAQQVSDRVLALLGRSRKMSTEDRAIGGGSGYPAAEQEQRQWVRSLAETCGLDPDRAALLFARYGTHAEKVGAFIAQGADRPIVSLPTYSIRELTFLARTEHVCRLADLLFRRTAIAMEGMLSPDAIVETASIAAEALGWDGPRRTREVDHCLFEFNRRQPLPQAA